MSTDVSELAGDALALSATASGAGRWWGQLLRAQPCNRRRNISLSRSCSQTSSEMLW